MTDTMDANAYFERGEAYLEKKNYDRAIADYSAAIRLAPQNGNAYQKRGYAYHEKGDIPSKI